MSDKPVYVIDGAEFATLEQFYDTISRVLIPNVDWGRNLNAFNDILRGGFGTPDGGFVLVWKNSMMSRIRLGYPETVRCLESTTYYPSNASLFAKELEAAKSQRGATAFDWLVEIIQVHGIGGEEYEDGVELRLE